MNFVQTNYAFTVVNDNSIINKHFFMMHSKGNYLKVLVRVIYLLNNK